MLRIKELSVSLTEEKKEIVKNANLIIRPGEVHLLNGRNGSGKSTLVNSIMGNPFFKVTDGSIELIDENYDDFTINSIDQDLITQKQNGLVSINITDAEPNDRSILGIFLANQYPTEIPGVGLTNFLRLIYNSRHKKEDQLSVFKFKKFIEERAELINYPQHLLKRNLNEGFSGGEKKKTEILQMLILEPRYVFLDEIDSGLDKNSVKEVFEGLSKFKKLRPETSFAIITHYDKAQEYLKPDFVHEMEFGKLVD